SPTRRYNAKRTGVGLVRNSAASVPGSIRCPGRYRPVCNARRTCVCRNALLERLVSIAELHVGETRPRDMVQRIDLMCRGLKTSDAEAFRKGFAPSGSIVTASTESNWGAVFSTSAVGRHRAG